MRRFVVEPEPTEDELAAIVAALTTAMDPAQASREMSDVASRWHGESLSLDYGRFQRPTLGMTAGWRAVVRDDM